MGGSSPIWPPMDGLPRRARSEDFAALQPLVKAFYEEEGYAGIDRARTFRALKRLLADAGLGTVWVVEEEGRILGYAVIAHGFSLEYGGRDAFLDEFFVTRRARGRGLGTALLDAAEAGARRDGVSTLHLEVEDGNPRAAGLYRRRGFGGNARRLLSKPLD